MSHKTYTCALCNKLYSSNSSLSNHNRITHGIRRNNIERKYECRYCNKEYIFPQSRWKHELTCKTSQDMEMAKIKEENERLLREKMEKNEEIIKLQKKLLNSKRMDNKTFKAVNKILMERSYKNSNNNNTINSNNTNTINNYQICSVGNEDLINVLTYQQKKQIMNSRFCSLEKIVEITHCGNMNQFKNIIITNLKDNFAYKYDDTKGYFVSIPKNILLDDVITHRITDIEAIYDELQSANKIDTKTKKIIQDFLDKIGNEETPFFENNTKYENYKSYKINNIKILLYNNQDKITKDIALLVSNTEEPVHENIEVL
jgi:hypothetical protein